MRLTSDPRDLTGFSDFILLRPEPGAAQSLAAAKKINLPARSFPAFVVEPCAWDVPDSEQFDGLLIGSANAFRHGGKGLSAYRERPVFAVGEQTADAARAAGLTVEVTGKGGLQTVLDGLAEKGASMHLLRLCGSERVELSPAPTISITERAVYQTVPVPMSDVLKQALSGERTLVALHSAAAGSKFAADCTANDIRKRTVTLLALGPRIAEAAGEGWAHVHICDVPSDTALLSMAASLCHGFEG